MLKSREFWGLATGAGFFLALVLSPPLAGLTRPAQNAAAVAALMACFWIGEVIPIYATALFPIVLFPLLGVLDAKAVTAPYADQVVFLMMGGFMLAEAMGRWGLHRRIALHAIRASGSTPSAVILGFMAATGFLSMWMSNSATAVMMLPIAVSVARRLQGAATPEDMKPDAFSAALMLAIAYSASIGGVATLVGTPPNAILAGQVKTIFPQAPEIFFDQWMRLGLPVAVAMIAIAWLMLTRVIFPLHQQKLNISRGLIFDELIDLGPMTRGEKTVLAVFTVTACLWIFRQLWSRWLPAAASVHDSTIAVAAALALFLIPVDLEKREFALDWNSARRIPWGVLILFGGGFALAAGLQQSGFAQWAASHLASLHHLPILAIIIIVCLLMTFLTEVTSNTAVATMMMPIMASTAVALQVHPFMLMMPAAISASCAFMLPAGTPPNAIVFGSGLIRLPQMARAGIWLNLIGVIVISLTVYFLAGIAFHVDISTLPAWAVLDGVK